MSTEASSNMAWADASLVALIRDLEFIDSKSAASSATSTTSPQTTVSDDSCEVEEDASQMNAFARAKAADNKKQQPALPKADYAVDHLDHSALSDFLQPSLLETKNAFPSKLVTIFKKKYFRFDNKALQCFPNCGRFADVREARMQGLDHKAGGRGDSFCTNQVIASTLVPPTVATESIVVVGRFLAATPEVGVLPESDAPLLDVGAKVATVPQVNAVTATVQAESAAVDSFGRREVAWTMQPEEAWFFNMTLPRHRRNAACAAHKVPLFVFELLVFVKQDFNTFQLCARTVSAPFEVASIRTLIREVLAFRQMNLPSTKANLRPQSAPDADMGNKTRTSLRQQMTGGYSNAVNRIRLAEANRKEEAAKKKVEYTVEIIPEPVAVQQPIVHQQQPAMDVIPTIPMEDISFEMPDLTSSDSLNIPSFDFGAMDSFFQPLGMDTGLDLVAEQAQLDDDLIP